MRVARLASIRYTVCVTHSSLGCLRASGRRVEVRAPHPCRSEPRRAHTAARPSARTGRGSIGERCVTCCRNATNASAASVTTRSARPVTRIQSHGRRFARRSSCCTFRARFRSSSGRAPSGRTSSRSIVTPADHDPGTTRDSSNGKRPRAPERRGPAADRRRPRSPRNFSRVVRRYRGRRRMPHRSPPQRSRRDSRPRALAAHTMRPEQFDVLQDVPGHPGRHRWPCDPVRLQNTTDRAPEPRFVGRRTPMRDAAPAARRPRDQHGCSCRGVFDANGGDCLSLQDWRGSVGAGGSSNPR